jgi:hypothetical protein
LCNGAVEDGTGNVLKCIILVDSVVT